MALLLAACNNNERALNIKRKASAEGGSTADVTVTDSDTSESIEADSADDVSSRQEPAAEVSAEVSSKADESKAEKKTEKPKKVFNDISDLEEQINTAVGSYYGSWSVYVKVLDSDAEISINNRQMYAASLIKLYAMAAAYEEIEAGSLDEAAMNSYLEPMITQSSNEAFNSVVWKLGTYYISNWCGENGYDDTIQCHGLYPASNADGLQVYLGSGYNVTTVEDCGHLLESIYKGECVSPKASKAMLELLLGQTFTWKIPAGLPEGVKCANKTGETDEVCHDAAIVYSEGADYVLTVMVEAGNAYECESSVAELSALVYNYFNS